MDEQKTRFLYKLEQDEEEKGSVLKVLPRLFICFEHEILEFILEGHQVIGRPIEGQTPDIPVTNQYVSRNHGCFDTVDGMVKYTAADTINGIIFRNKRLSPGECVELWDGDELLIPSAGGENSVDIMLVCAISRNRINIWRDLRVASRDYLTGLAGRNNFKTWYLHNFLWKKSSNFCLFILDIDYFKKINDVYGHGTGDEALKLLSEQLLLTVRNSGYVCRWGGDEFVGVMDEEPQIVESKLNEMRGVLKRTRIRDQLNLTISVGVLYVQQDVKKEDVDKIVLMADKVLYKAKELGRDRICVYTY